MNIHFKKYPILKSDEVHIWSASLLENKNDIAYCISILSEDECERASSFRFFKDQKQFIITRAILRCLLSKYLQETPENIEIVYSLWGKPCLLQEKALYFNVSHSRNYALYAMTRSHEVGIDLVYIDKSLILEDMAGSIFSKPELTYWRNLDLEDRVNFFFTRWVSKEAFLKASGKGWLEDKEFEFNFKPDFRKNNIDNEVINPYCFEYITGYASALFVNGALLRPSYYSWDQSRFKFEEA